MVKSQTGKGNENRGESFITFKERKFGEGDNHPKKFRPKKTDWKDMGDGLYRSTDKFVRTKSGTVKDIKYSISGAPSGLTVGEIKTDSSQIDDEADLKKYDICVAQTDASSASSNFYLYCNEEAMKERLLTIKARLKSLQKLIQMKGWS